MVTGIARPIEGISALRVRSAVTAGLVAAAVALTGPAASGQAQGQPPPDPEPVRAAIEVLTQAQAQLDQAQVELDVAIAGGLALQREHDELVNRQVELELDRVGDRPSPALDEVEGRLADVRDRMREADAERSERSAEVERRQEAVRAASEGVDRAWVQVLADQANQRWAEVEAARAALDAAVAALGDGDDPAATAAVAAATTALERTTVAHGAALDLVDQELKRQQQDRSTLEEDRDVQLGEAIDLVRERAERYAGLRLEERHFESLADLIRHRQQGPDRAVRAAGATRAEADGLANWLERASGASGTMVTADASARQAMRELVELTGELGLDAPADAYDVAALVAHETAAAALAAAQAARNLGGILRDEERGAFMEELVAWADRWEDLAEELLEVERFQATQSEAAELRAAAGGDPEAVWELTEFLRRWSEELNQAALEARDDTAVRAGDLADDIWADRLVRLERQLAMVEEQFEAALATPGARAPALPAQVASALEGLGDDDRLRRVEDRVDVLADAFEALRALRDQTRTQEALLRDEVQDLRRELAAEAARGSEADRGRLEQLEDLVAEEQAQVAERRRAALTLAEQVERIGKDIERDAAWLAQEADRLGREARRAARKLGRDADAAERRRVADQAVAAAEAARRALAAAERTAGTAEDDEVLADRVLARRRVAAQAASAATLRVREAEAAERARQAALRRRTGGGDPGAARTLLATLERQRAELDQGDVLESGRGKGRGRSRLDRRRAELDREIEALRDTLGEPAPESEAQPKTPEPTEPTEPPAAGPAGKDAERRTPEANAAPAPDPDPEPGPGGQAPLATEPVPLPAAPFPDAPPITPATPAPEQPTPWVPMVELGEDEEGDGAGMPAWVPLRTQIQGSLGDAPVTCGPKDAAATCAPDPPVVGAGDPCLDRGGLGAVMATCAPPEDPLDTGTIFDPLPEKLTGQRLIFDPPPDDDLIGKPRILDPEVEPPTGPSCGLAGNVLVTCKDDLFDPAVIVTWSGPWLDAEPPAADRPAGPALRHRLLSHAPPFHGGTP